MARNIDTSEWTTEFGYEDEMSRGRGPTSWEVYRRCTTCAVYDEHGHLILVDFISKPNGGDPSEQEMETLRQRALAAAIERVSEGY